MNNQCSGFSFISVAAEVRLGLPYSTDNSLKRFDFCNTAIFYLFYRYCNLYSIFRLKANKRVVGT